MNKKFIKFIKWMLIAFISTIFISLSLILILPSLTNLFRFSQLPITLETYDLFDLGVVDANSDSNLDVFTTNHSARQSLKLGNGKGQFQEVLSDWNLDQDREFPSLEDSLTQPEFSEPGLYIYRQDKALYLHGHELGQQTISGTLQLSWPVKIELQKLFDVETNQEKDQLGGVKTIVKFDSSNNGWLVIRGKDDIVEIPHVFQIDPQVPLANIHIGVNGLQPNNHSFELMWRDRHSMAWTDFNRDKQLDVFIGRGGVKAQIELVSDNIDDELMISTEQDQVLENKIAQLGIKKHNCPARQSAWVDVNNDELLDLYILCGNGFTDSPNQLYMQQSDGKFNEVAATLGLDFAEYGCFRWLDFDDDRDMDLLIARGKSLWLYVQNQGKFESKLIVNNLPAQIGNIHISDFDLDGDIDAYAESRSVSEPNLLLINDNLTFSPVDPQFVGLPNQGVGASWVDYDNDGYTDFYVVPDGLFHQSQNHTFQKTGLLDERWHTARKLNVRSVWFDLDNDGFRDLLSVAKQMPPLQVRLLNRFFGLNWDSNWTKLWKSQLWKNNFTDNHWLEIDLLSSSNNPQSIGTKVIVKTPTHEQVQVVGSAENSYYSQGHYRLYFGIGKERSVSSLKIFWPDGEIQQINDIDADQILLIKQGTAIIKQSI